MHAGPGHRAAGGPAARHTLPDVASQRPVGTITRGTTNPNRLRRVDRWLAGPQALAAAPTGAAPVVVDLGYGASPVTAVELHARLRRVRADVEVVGIEIDPARVRAARPLEREGLTFRARRVRGAAARRRRADRRAGVQRAAPVRRGRGRRRLGDRCATGSRPAACWSTAPATSSAGAAPGWRSTADGPRSLSLSLRLPGLQRPSDVAERLPKALIHRNVPGERIHAFLTALDAGMGTAGAARVVRRAAAVPRHGRRRCASEGWPLLDGPARWRLGELTVAWSAVAPR